MNPRYYGVAAMLVGLLGIFFFLSPGETVILPFLFSAITAVGLYQTIYGFSSFSEAFNKLEKAHNPSTVNRLLALAPLAVGGLGILWFASSRVSDMTINELSTNGAISQGVITKAWTSKRRRSATSYHVNVAFADENKKAYTLDSDVSASEFSLVEGGQEIVEVIYSKNNPEIFDLIFSPQDKAKYGK